MSETVLALYDTLENANDAISDLVSEGFNRRDIGLVVNNTDESGITELVAGLTVLSIPDIGPIIAAGPLAVTLGGAVAGSLAASFIDLGIPESQVDYYGEAIRRGSVLVSVIAEDIRVIESMRILNRHNPYDVEYRARQKGKARWKGYTEPNHADYAASRAETHTA